MAFTVRSSRSATWRAASNSRDYRSPEPTAEQAAAALESLFREHGVPLVLKSENGSPFTAERSVAMLAAYYAVRLLSTTYTPRYNVAYKVGFAD